jgi:putative FmdB family regulatory protein
MPIYEYNCLDCGARFDALRAIKDADAPILCNQCESKHTKRDFGFLCPERRACSCWHGGGCAGCESGSCSSCNH